MDNVFVAMIITIIVVSILFLVMPIFYNKFNNFDFYNLFSSINDSLNALQTIFDNIPISQNVKNTLDLITNYAKEAVQYAEQLYKSGQLSEDLRKEKAVEYIKEILKISNIEITEEIEKIIDATIESAVLLLPKTKEEWFFIPLKLYYK